MKYIKGFDSLRAFSIVFVFLSHLGVYHLIPNSFIYKERFWKLISGSTGVNIFFTLSGFLITLILISEIKQTGRINFIKFFARRFLRLLPPLFLFYIIIALLMYFKLIHTYKIGLFYSMFYIYNYLPKELLTPELVHTWSLAIEEQYYLIWPFILYYFRNRIQNIIYVTIFFICAGVLIMYILIDIEFSQNFMVDRWFFPASIPIFIGSIFAVFISLKSDILKTLLSDSRIIIFAFLFYFYPLFGIYDMLTSVFQSIGVGIFLVFIYYHQNNKFVLVLDNKFLSYIGKISYGLYVYQGLFLRTGPGGKLWVQQIPQNLILTIILAILSFQFIEKRILKLKNKIH